MSNTVHTKGSIGRRGIAQGIICETCPGGCKTDCLRAGVTDQVSKLSGNDYSTHKEIEKVSENNFTINFTTVVPMDTKG